MGLESDREALVGLQRGQSAGRFSDAVAPLRVLHRPWAIAQQAADDVLGLVAPGREQPLPGAPDRERLAAGHDLHPRDQRPRVTVGRLRKQDLHRPLERVLGVVRTQRQSPRRAPKVGLGHRQQREGALTPAAGESRVLRGHARNNPSGLRAAPAPTAADGVYLLHVASLSRDAKQNGHRPP